MNDFLVFNDQKVKKHLPQSSNLELHNDRLNWLEVNTQCFLLNIMSLFCILQDKLTVSSTKEWEGSNSETKRFLFLPFSC